MAILGTCAASQVAADDGQHFYLARRATLDCEASPQLLMNTKAKDGLLSHARARFTGKRSVEAEVRLNSRLGAPLWTLRVAYDALDADTFASDFADAFRELRSATRQTSAPVPSALPFSPSELRHNPYQNPLPLQHLTFDRQTVRAVLPRVFEQHCSGHFAMHPMLPVAVVAGELARLSGLLLGRIVAPGETAMAYQVRRVEIKADDLARAGAQVDFGVSYLGPEIQNTRFGDDVLHVFESHARVGETTVGQMRIWLHRFSLTKRGRAAQSAA